MATGQDGLSGRMDALQEALPIQTLVIKKTPTALLISYLNIFVLYKNKIPFSDDHYASTQSGLWRQRMVCVCTVRTNASPRRAGPETGPGSWLPAKSMVQLP